jgi:hypothetical protein
MKNKNILIIFSILTITSLLAGIPILKISNQLMNSIPGDSWTAPLNLSITNKFAINSIGDDGIAIDSKGNLHVVFSQISDNDAGNSEIYYVTNSSGSWNWINISSFNMTGARQQQPVIAIDSEDTVHIVWSGQNPATGEYDLLYVNNYNDTWSVPYNITKLSSSTSSASSICPSIVFDNYDTLHVAYIESNFSTVAYLNRVSAGNWTGPINITQPPYTFTGINEKLSISVNRLNWVYISFSAYNGTDDTSEIYVLNNSIGVWSLPLNISRDWQTDLNRDLRPSMAIDSFGNIHIGWAFENTSYYGYKYSKVYGSTFTSCEIITLNNESNEFLRLLTDPYNRIHLLYTININGYSELFYVNNTKGNFSNAINITFTNSTNEKTPQIVIDDYGYAHITYQSGEKNIYYIKSNEPVAPPPPPIDLTIPIIIIGAILVVVINISIAFFLLKRQENL